MSLILKIIINENIYLDNEIIPDQGSKQRNGQWSSFTYTFLHQLEASQRSKMIHKINKPTLYVINIAKKQTISEIFKMT